MDVVPPDPDAWTEEEWLAHLQDQGPDVGETDRTGSPGHRRLRSSPGGAVIGAAMVGLERALYGERPAEDVVVEADADDPFGDASHFDPDDPGSSTIALAPEPPRTDGDRPTR